MVINTMIVRSIFLLYTINSDAVLVAAVFSNRNPCFVVPSESGKARIAEAAAVSPITKDQIRRTFRSNVLHVFVLASA